MSQALSFEAPERAPTEETHAFTFTGSAGEFFRIWIVNVSLTVLTLGIYSAWAKVRTSRYFAANTHLAGASFDYLADPIAILKGRIIVVVVLVIYSSSSALSPFVQGPIGLLLAAALPWAICRSLAFRAHNTAWRNIRFAFGGTYGEAFMAYLLLPILGMIPLGLGYPFAVASQRRFMVENAAFGTTRFHHTQMPSSFYGLFLRLGFIAVFGGGLAFALTSQLEPLLEGLLGEDEAAGAVAIAMTFSLLPLYFALFAYYSAQIMNLTYDGTRLDQHTLYCRVPSPKLAWIYLTNGLAILASLGLLIPWSHVRTARFRLAHMGIVARGSLDAFVAAQSDDVSSLGAEFGEALDFDLGL